MAEKQMDFQGKGDGWPTSSEVFALLAAPCFLVHHPVSHLVSSLQHLPSCKTLTRKVTSPEPSDSSRPDSDGSSVGNLCFTPLGMTNHGVLVSPNCSPHYRRFLSPFMMSLFAAVGWVSLERGNAPD